MLVGLFALVATTLFAGAALYGSLVEHPSRMQLDDESAVAQWRSSQARAAPLQAVLALLGLGLGLWAWQRTDDPWVLVAALLVGANLPLTLIAIMPINRRLRTAPAGAEVRAMLGRWGGLHGLRTLLGLAAIICLLYAFLWP